MVVFACVIWISERDSKNFKKIFFQSWQMHFDFFFQAFISNFFSETSKSTCFEVRKHFQTLLDETTQRRLLLKKKVKSFFPVEKVTQSKKQSQSQHLVNLFSLSQHIVAFASRKWKKKEGCKVRYPIFPSYFRLWGSQCLCSFFKIHLREGCKNVRKTCPQILCAFTYTFLCVDVCGLFNNIYHGKMQPDPVVAMGFLIFGTFWVKGTISERLEGFWKP